MEVFRLTKRKYAHTLSGLGAARFGNRWNSKGVEMIYTAQNCALAMAEVAVHLSLATLPDDFVMLEIDIPGSVDIRILDQINLGSNWDVFPYNPNTQLLGNAFIANQKSAVLKVPSAVVKGEHNFLINPNHKDATNIKIIRTYDFPFDRRIFK